MVGVWIRSYGSKRQFILSVYCLTYCPNMLYQTITLLFFRKKLVFYAYFFEKLPKENVTGYRGLV